jgi:hypothetical protein
MFFLLFFLHVSLKAVYTFSISSPRGLPCSAGFFIDIMSLTGQSVNWQMKGVLKSPPFLAFLIKKAQA